MPVQVFPGSPPGWSRTAVTISSTAARYLLPMAAFAVASLEIHGGYGYIEEYKV